MNSTAPLETICTRCGEKHPIELGQFPPGVLELLRWDDGLAWAWDLIDHLWNGMEPPDYPGALADLRKAIEKRRPANVLVVGSMSPWIECLPAFGVTTTNLSPIRIQSERIKYAEPSAAYAAKYDAVISYSSLEHFGLGRYGDPLNANADKEWMRMIRNCIAPGGRLILAVPVGPEGRVEGCWHRIYGPTELSALLDGWKIESVTRAGIKLDAVPFDVPSGLLDWQNQPLLTLVPNQ